VFGFQFKSPVRRYVYFIVIHDVIARSETWMWSLQKICCWNCTYQSWIWIVND